MTRFLLRISLAAAALASVSAVAIAADMPPPPPPPPDMRPATYDWTGPYVGGVASAVFIDTHYLPICPGGGGACPDPDLDGDGFAGGVIAGYNVQWDDFVMGFEADWMWGGKNADNILDALELNLDSIATFRARAGIAMDDTLIYVTGGYAVADVELDALVGVAALPMSDSNWHDGWTIGVGIEHAIWDSLHVRLEYLYANFGKEDYDFQTGDPLDPGGIVRTGLDDVHMVRGAITWNFTI
jgi:outer membrane immunogenic protein